MSMFDDDFTEEMGEEIEVFDEEAPPDEDDVRLAELGMRIDIADRYRNHHSETVLTKKNVPTSKFFDFYLECSDKETLEQIRKDDLPKNLQDKIEKAVPVSEKYIEKDRYIKKNRELLQQNKELQDDLNVALTYLSFLYDLMGAKFTPKGKFTKDEMDTVKQIKEELKK